MKKFFVILLISAAFLFGFVIKPDIAKAQTSNMNTADTLYYSGQFCKFSNLLERADLNRVLRGKGPYTVFAPTDACMAKLPPGMVEHLSSCGNECQLNRTMRYHIVSSCVQPNQIGNVGCIKTTDGRCIQGCPGCKVNNINIVDTIYTKNGVIYVVDNLLLPNQQITLNTTF